MNRTTTTALTLLLASACLDVPEYAREPGVAEGEGEGEGEGPAEGEGEGPAEGEAEGPAEGEGEGPPPAPPHVERLQEDLEVDTDVSGAEFSADEREIGVYRPYGSVELHALDDSGRLRVIDVDETPQSSLFAGFALSPTLPLAVTKNDGGDIQTWSIEGDGTPEYLAAWSPGDFGSRMIFDAAGEKVVVLTDGRATVVRVAGGVSEAFTEPEYEARPGQQAVFVGPDDVIVVLEDPARARLRICPTLPDGSGVAAQWREPDECETITAIAGARAANRLAYVCGNGTAWVVEPIPWGEPRPFRARLGTLDSPSLSPDGRLLAALEDEHLNVFDTETGGRATIEVGTGDDHYGRGAAFSPDGRRLALDRDRRVVVMSVRPADAE